MKVPEPNVFLDLNFFLHEHTGVIPIGASFELLPC
jgi:hypothetical protein